MTLGPAPVLAFLLAILHVSLYVLIRGSAGNRLPWLIGAAFLGAWAGDSLATRLGGDPLLVGDFHVVGASLLAWVGIAVVAIVAVLGPPTPSRDATREPDAAPSQHRSRMAESPPTDDAEPDA